MDSSRDSWFSSVLYVRVYCTIVYAPHIMGWHGAQILDFMYDRWDDEDTETRYDILPLSAEFSFLFNKFVFEIGHVVALPDLPSCKAL